MRSIAHVKREQISRQEFDPAPTTPLRCSCAALCCRDRDCRTAYRQLANTSGRGLEGRPAFKGSSVTSGGQFYPDDTVRMWQLHVCLYDKLASTGTEVVKADRSLREAASSAHVRKELTSPNFRYFAIRKRAGAVIGGDVVDSGSLC